MLTPKERELCLGLLRLFRYEGKTVDQIVTEGQLEIFCELVFRKNKSNESCIFMLENDEK